MAQTDSNVLERIRRALYPVDATKPDGDWQVRIPGGAGGTSTTDATAFTPGASSLTPMGAYVGGRQIGSGNVAAPAMDGSGMLYVHVGAGGAGGGLSQLQIVGTDNQNFANVGWPSGGDYKNTVPVQFGPSGFYPTVNVAGVLSATVLLGNIPTVNLGLATVNIGNIPTVNVGLGGGGFATVGVYGSPAFPVYVVGTINPGSVFTVNLGLGTVNVGNGLSGTLTIASPVDTANSAVRVSVVSGGAGGGVAQLQVVGSDNSAWRNVGFASGNWQGLNTVPVVYGSGLYPTVNLGAMIAATAILGAIATVNLGFGTVNLGNIPGVIGTVNPGSVFTVNLGLGTVNIGNGLSATVLLGNIPTVNLGLGTVNLGNIPTVNIGNLAKVDIRGALVPTTWIISTTGSGTYLIASTNTGTIKIYGFKVITDGTIDCRFESASGNGIEGTYRLLPGAGFSENAPMGTPLLICPSGLYLRGAQVANLGGIARGWVE